MALAATDSDIQQNVWDEVSHDIRVDANNINVRVVNGVVYLDGTVETYTEKLTVGEDARRIKGVIDVVNNLVVSPPQTATDADIDASIRRKLDLDVRIADPGKVQLSVTGGVVTLTGTAPTYLQKSAAAEDAWSVTGVVDVINNVVVVPSQKRRDADVECDVRQALDVDPDLNAALINVSVTNGFVYLRGTVPTYYQVEEGAQDARTVPGVADVINELHVAA